jgi:thioredoxin 1
VKCYSSAAACCDIAAQRQADSLFAICIVNGGRILCYNNGTKINLGTGNIMAVLTLTKENFKETIESNDFVIVDFWAPWCDPCVAFTPTFEAAAAKHTDIVFGMVNTETDPEISDYFDVKQIPGLLVIRERAGIHAQVGEIGAPAFDEIIKWARDFDMTQVRKHYAEEDAKNK